MLISGPCPRSRVLAALHRVSRVTHMRRINWKTVSTLMAMGLLAGCTETVVEPMRSSFGAPETATMARAPEGRPSLTMTTAGEPNGTSTFTVGPNGGMYVAGTTVIVFPANSVCDPQTSSYGVGTWDNSCTTITSPIQITAISRVQNGRTQVDFSPSLRFAPSDNPTRWVWLYMSVPSLARTTDLEAFKIFYAPTLDGPLVDESVTDHSLRTFVDTRTGTSLRRVKHFTGYVVIGRTCDAAVESCSDSTTTP